MCYCPRSAPGVQLTPHHNTPPFQLAFWASIRCENIDCELYRPQQESVE